MKHLHLIFSTIVLFILFSCNNTNKRLETTANEIYEPKYARFFRIEYFDDYKKISILNPWKNEDLNINYYLINENISSIKTDSKNFILKQQPGKVIALSSPMVGLLNILKLDSTIIGISDPEYIYNDLIFKKIEEGQIVNVGKSISVNMETIISLQADLIIGSGWDKLSPDFERMIQLKQTPLLMYDWQETHPLGKAEWMVLLSAFFNKDKEAIEGFNSIETKYNELKNTVHYDKKPSIFNGSEYQGIWYSAGGQSYMSQLFKDAGAKYIMRNDSSTGSIMLDFEVIMSKAEKADIWMYTGSTDQANLSLLNSPKYQSISAVKNHRVFSYNRRMNDRGANEYWETASYKPEVVLQDMIKIFHDNNPQNLYYFGKVDY